MRLARSTRQNVPGGGRRPFPHYPAIASGLLLLGCMRYELASSAMETGPLLERAMEGKCDSAANAEAIRRLVKGAFSDSAAAYAYMNGLLMHFARSGDRGMAREIVAQVAGLPERHHRKCKRVLKGALANRSLDGEARQSAEAFIAAHDSL